MTKHITGHVGLDVHKDSIGIAEAGHRARYVGTVGPQLSEAVATATTFAPNRRPASLVLREIPKSRLPFEKKVRRQPRLAGGPTADRYA